MYQTIRPVLVVDLEATCANDGSFPPEVMEIIEIGAVWATPAGAVFDHFQTFVRPLQRPKLTSFCTALTGIQQSDVNAAPLFPVAAQALREFADRRRDSDDAMWASWGAYDRKQLERDCARHGVENPLRLPHENLKRLFAKSQRIEKAVTLASACGLVHLQIQGTWHRALDDAINTAHLLPWVWGAESVGDVKGGGG